MTWIHVPRHSAEQLSAEFEARVEELETELQSAEADSAKVLGGISDPSTGTF